MQSPGEWIHRVSLATPGPPISDGDGGVTPVWVPLSPPTLRVSIAAATVRDLERLAAGTTIASATSIVRGPYHAGITTQTRLAFENGRLLSVTSVVNVDERNRELTLLCEELVP